MHARVSRIAGSPQNVEQGISAFKNSTLSQVTSTDGNKGAILLVDRESGTALALTLWQDEEAMQASEETANQLRQAASEEMGAGGQAQVERYEVVVFET